MAEIEITHDWVTAEPDSGKDVDAPNLNDHRVVSIAIAGEDITSGTVADARIASTIARDSEVTSAVAALSTVYQPVDSDLTSIAALTTTAYGRAFLALANAAAGRTALALGTAATAATGDFDAAGAAAAAQAASQPLDSDLTSITALTTTAFGRGLLELANQAALLSAAGAAASGHNHSGTYEPAGTVATHTGDSSDAHDASAVSVLDTAANFTGTDVEAVLAELQDNIDGVSGTGAPTDADYLVGTANGSLSAEIVVGTSPGGELGGTWASPTVDATHSGSTHAATQAAAEATAAAALAGHTGDTTDAHDASAISVLDTANDFTATDVEGALAELQSDAETHAAAADPHAGYRLESADHTHASTGAQAGTIDHGALTGVSDDDHPQYVLESAIDTFLPRMLVAASDASAKAIAAADYVCDGTADDVQIQAAVDALPATGGVVELSGGTFTLAAGIVVTDDGVAIVGQGPATKLYSGSAIDLITFSNVDFWGCRDLYINGSWNGTRGAVLLGARWGNMLNILGDEFAAPMLDLRADGSATQNVNNNLIQHVHAVNATAFIRMLGDAGNRVTLNVLEQISAVGAGTAVSTLIDLAGYADTNKFGFVRVGLGFAGSTGVVLNSDAPSSVREVYGNLFDEVAIDQDAAGTVSVQANNTASADGGPWANVFEHIRIGGTNPTSPVIAGANSYIAIGHPLGSIPTASLPTAASHVAGTQVWDSTTGTPKWSDGSAWLEGSLSTHDHDADYEASGAVAAHTGDAADAHDASAISVLDTAANFTGADVEAVLAELQDNIDGVSGGGTPATTVEAETSFGISAAVGTDTEYARQDHTHGTPTDPVTAHAAAGDPHADYVLEAATPGGELGGTYASPTVDATHSGSTHAATQAAAEATAAAALAAHTGDTSDAHDASAISILDTDGNFAATNVETVIAELQGQWQASISGHINDAADAHDASAISVLDTGALLTATDVEAALAEIAGEVDTNTSGLAAHIVDTSGAHAASATSFTPAGTIAATDVQAAIQELDTEKSGTGHDHDADYEAAGGIATHAAAADPHTGYVKETDLDTLVVWADDMIASGGSVASSNVNRWGVKSFDATAIENTSKSVQIPAHWATFDIAILWANGAAGTGNVVWGAGVAVAGAANGESLTSPTYTEVAAVAAGSQNAVISTAILTGQSASSLKRCLVSVRRKADDAGDTLANDANLVAAVLTKAS